MKRTLLSAIIMSALSLILPMKTGLADNGKTADYFDESFKYETARNYDAALNGVLKILRMDQKNYVAALRLGWLYYLKGDFSAAEKSYKKVIAIAPQAIEAKLGLMLPLMAAKRWAETETVARQVLQVDDMNYTAASRLAYALYMQAKYADAMFYYKKVLTWYPSDMNIKLGLAWAYHMMGRKDEAVRQFKEVLEVYKNHQGALYGLSVTGK
jgi:tetratricopeptide (TPR) repeat protein